VNAVVQIVADDPAGTGHLYAAVCPECDWTSIKSLFKFYAQADALNHDAQLHLGKPRRKSMLIDRQAMQATATRPAPTSNTRRGLQ